MCDWSLDLCSSYLPAIAIIGRLDHRRRLLPGVGRVEIHQRLAVDLAPQQGEVLAHARPVDSRVGVAVCRCSARKAHRGSSSAASAASIRASSAVRRARSEEHTSELQSLMRNSYAVFCLKKKNNNNIIIQRYTEH